MSVKTEAEFKKLKVIGSIVRKTLDQTAAAARCGMTTAELDGIGRNIAGSGSRTCPRKGVWLSGRRLHSVNDEAVHGVQLVRSAGGLG